MSDKEQHASLLQDLVSRRPANQSYIVLPSSSPVLNTFADALTTRKMKGTDFVHVSVSSANRVIEKVLLHIYKEVKYILLDVSATQWFTPDQYAAQLASEDDFV